MDSPPSRPGRPPSRKGAGQSVSSDRQLMKDGLGVVAIKRIGANLHRAWQPFPESRFVQDASDGLDRLELKQRVLQAIAVLADCLPKEYESAVDILLEAGREWDSGVPGDPLNGFAAWPLIDFIGEYGLSHPRFAFEIFASMTGMSDWARTSSLRQPFVPTPTNNSV